MLPDVPIAPATVPGLVAIGWQALVPPKGTPDYAPDLPPSKRVVTVDPAGAIVVQKPQYSSAR